MKTYKDYITETEEEIRLQEWIPLAITGLGAAWSAYDAWKLKQAYDRGEISIEALVKQVGTDVAITIAGGAVAKVGKTGWKFGKKIYNSKKDAMQAVADKINKRIEPTISSQGSKKLQSPVDKNFDRTQKMSDYGKTGPVDPEVKIPSRSLTKSPRKTGWPNEPKPPKQEILPPEVNPPKPGTSYQVSQRAKPGEPEIIRPGEQSYGAAEKRFVELSRLRQEKELARTLAKSRSPEAIAKRAEIKAQQLAKYKETGNVENLRGLSVSDIYKAGGKEALMALSKKLD